MRKLVFALVFVLLIGNFFAPDPPAPSDPKEWVKNVGAGSTGGGILIDSLTSNFNSNVVGAFTTSYLGAFVNADECEKAIDIKDIIIPTAFVSFLMIIMIVIIYMLGQVLQSSNLIALAKTELQESIQSILIAVFILILIIGATQWFTTAANQADPIYKGQPSLIDAAMQYSKFMAYQITGQLSGLLIFNTFVQTIYSATVYVGVTLKAMFSFNVGPILKPIVDILGIVIQFLTTALGEWLLHYVMLCFVKRWTWTMFIPIGILLRAIPQTRQAGNGLLALFLSISFIYPLMMVANWEVFKLTYPSVLPAQSVVGSFFQSSGILGVGLFGIMLMLTLGSVVMPFLMGLMITVVFELVRTSIYYIVIISVLLPFMNIFLTLTAARETARAFGSEISFSGFVKLI